MKGIRSAIFDSVFFVVILLYFIFAHGLDPGTVTFLYAFENIFMATGFWVFSFLFVPWAQHYYYKTIHDPANGDVALTKKSLASFYIGHLFIGVVMIIIGALLILFLDQVLVSFMSGFFLNNGYILESIQILDREGLFVSQDILVPFLDHTGIHLGELFLIVSGRYFLEFTIQLFSRKTYLKKDPGLNGAYTVALRVILGPILMLVSVLIMVLLTSMFGVNHWIMVATLILFRVLIFIVTLFLDGDDDPIQATNLEVKK